MAKIITYDLKAPGRDYSTLISEIKKYSNCVKVTESTWIVSSSDACSDIRDHLVNYIDSNDRLFVANLSGEAAWRNSICSNDDLKTILNP